MSKMPKKKSCFQITSVTQAQVAASSITDDTKSLDDLDESRKEDVSSEIYDVSHANLGSSEETLSNDGESLELLLPNTGPVSEGDSYKIIGVGQLATYNLEGSLSGPSTAPTNGPTTHPLTVINPGPASSVPAHTPSVSTNCSSRFRVIKLDHGTGEPFRRGRWMCTEFYERESDSNIHKAVDSIKTGLTVVCSIERDSGLGATINSVVSSSGLSLQAFENITGGVFSLEPPSHLKTLDHPQQDYSLTAQLVSGSEKPQLAQGIIQPVAPQTCTQNSLNGVHQTTTPVGVSTAQQDYYQQHFGLSTQSPSAPTHPAWSQSNPVVSPELVSACQRPQMLNGEARLAKGIQLQEGISSALVPTLTGSDQQQHTNHTQSSGSVGISLASSLSSNGGVHNAFAIVTSTSLRGGHFQPHSAQVGLLKSLPSSLGNHAEDHRPTADSPPHVNAVVVPGSDGVKPFITDGLGLPTPAVNGLFGIHIAMNDDDDSTSGASVVAIDNKIEQAMDLVKSHLMYAVREEVEVLKEHIKELYERNSVLERENALLKSLASSEQLGQLPKQLIKGSNSPSPLPLQQQQQQYPLITNNINNGNPALSHSEGQSIRHQPNITSV